MGLPSEPRTNAASGVQVAAAEIDIGINLREAKVWEPDPTETGPAPIGDMPPLKDVIEQSKGFDLLNEIPGEKSGPSGIGFPKNIQWMVFKVKQRSAMLYDEIIATDMPTPQPDGTGLGLIPPIPCCVHWMPFRRRFGTVEAKSLGWAGSVCLD